MHHLTPCNAQRRGNVEMKLAGWIRIMIIVRLLSRNFTSIREISPETFPVCLLTAVLRLMSARLIVEPSGLISGSIKRRSMNELFVGC
jgi:hypothetical protein